MRVLGFSRLWPKLKKDYFTTFRFSRRDKDWGRGEPVQVVLNPRSKKSETLGIAKIIRKEKRWVTYNPPAFTLIGKVSYIEAEADGFDGVNQMIEWVQKTYRLPKEQSSSTIQGRNDWEPMNKLALRWVSKGLSPCLPKEESPNHPLCPGGLRCEG